MADYVYKAFDVADEYRTPVLILADGMLGADHGTRRAP